MCTYAHVRCAYMVRIIGTPARPPPHENPGYAPLLRGSAFGSRVVGWIGQDVVERTGRRCGRLGLFVVVRSADGCRRSRLYTARTNDQSGWINSPACGRTDGRSDARRMHRNEKVAAAAANGTGGCGRGPSEEQTAIRRLSARNSSSSRLLFYRCILIKWRRGSSLLQDGLMRWSSQLKFEEWRNVFNCRRKASSGACLRVILAAARNLGDCREEQHTAAAADRW